MSGKEIYTNPYFSSTNVDQNRDEDSSESSERSEPPVWESAVDSRGELFYAELDETPVIASTPGPPPREVGEVRATPPLPPAPASAGEKLRRLLRRRRSQRMGRAELSAAAPLSPQRRAPAGRTESAEETAADGEVYRVVVRLDSGHHAAGQPGPLCESLLGLIGYDQLKPGDAASHSGGSGEHQAVTVAALVPRGPLIRSPLVRIGDRLERVNGSPVSADTLETILTALPRAGKVRLSFRRAAVSATQPGSAPLTNGVAGKTTTPNGGGDGSGEDHNTTPTADVPPSGDGRVTSLSGDGLGLEELGQRLRGLPFGLLCLSTDGLTENSPERADVVYQFPGYDTALLSARGSLLTVAGLTKQISGDTPLRAAIRVGSAPVHVAIACQEDLVLLLAAPEVSLSAAELHQLGTELWQLLRLEFGSLRSAFTEASQRPYVDHLLALVFQQALLTPELTGGVRGALPQRQPGGLDRLLAAAHAMHLPRHVQVLIEDSLTELEAADFGEESEDVYGLERLYLLRGSALYYKGYLMASHLPPEDQANIHLLLRHRQLLERSRRGRWRQLVVWRRYRRPTSASSSASVSSAVAGSASAAGATAAAAGAASGVAAAATSAVPGTSTAAGTAGTAPGVGGSFSVSGSGGAVGGAVGGAPAELTGEEYDSEELDQYLMVVGAAHRLVLSHGRPIRTVGRSVVVGGDVTHLTFAPRGALLQKHALLAVLLESGACTAQLAAGAGPDSIYVEEAQATLYQLESMGIMDMCESWLGGNPSLNTSAEDEEELPGGARLYEGTARDTLLETRWWSRLVAARRTDSRHSRNSHEHPSRADGSASMDDTRSGGGGGSVTGSATGSSGGGGGGGGGGGATWRRDGAGARPDSPGSAAETSGGAPTHTSSHSQSDDGDSSTDDSAADTWEIYRGPPKSRLLPNQYDLMENKKIYMGQALEDSRRVVPDSFSLALQHVLLDVPAATYLALPEPQLTAWVRPELLTAFSRAVARLLPLLTPHTPVAGGFSGSGSAGPDTPQEVGTLFTLDGQQGQTFWVVGRQVSLPSRRQLFVCVPGSTPPNMLELAFRLAHGTGPR